MGRLCDVCKTDISARTGRAKYCEPCAIDVKREQVRMGYKKHKYVTPVCFICRVGLINANRNTKYCEACREIVRKKSNTRKPDDTVCTTEGCEVSIDGALTRKKYCDDCIEKNKKVYQKRYRDERIAGKSKDEETCLCGDAKSTDMYLCQECANNPKRTERRNRRDPNSAVGKLLKRIGKPKSAIGRCY